MEKAGQHGLTLDIDCIEPTLSISWDYDFGMASVSSAD